MNIQALPTNGNGGIVPPHLQNPIRILPMPEGWEPAPPATVLVPAVVEDRLVVGSVS
jgi:hypothetical protein